MASEHDLGLAARVAAGDAAGVHVVDDPVAVCAAAEEAGAVAVDLDDLDRAVAAARVHLAELVLARARDADADLAASVVPAAPPAPPDRTDGEDPRRADRQAIRFALVILVPALGGGIAVYAADGLVLAPALPALALLVVGGVALAHRVPRAPEPVGAAPPIAGPVVVEAGPAQRAAEAHLRRQRAAWKLAWWEHGEPVPDPATWSSGSVAAPPLTLVTIDPSRRTDPDAHATMTAALPAAVQVVVLQPRP